GGIPDLGELLRREDVRRVLSALNGRERPRDHRMELLAALALDLGQRLLAGHARAERLLGRHRVERVREDQEVRGERDVLAADAVVAAAVVALAVVLDGLRL